MGHPKICATSLPHLRIERWGTQILRIAEFNDELDGADAAEGGDSGAGDDGEIGSERGDGDKAEVRATGEQLVGAERGGGGV